MRLTVTASSFNGRRAAGGVKGRQAPLLSPRCIAHCTACWAYQSGGGGWLTTSRPAARYGSDQQMARPDGRAFCALWAQSRRAAAHSGGPRPSRPASASLRPRSGRGPSGGPCGPGLGPALPTRRPRGLVLLTARQRDASPAGWWGLPSAPSGRVPPAPSGLRAATPAHPGRLGRRPPRPPAAVGDRWRLVAACGGSGLRPCGACQPPAVARGHPVGPQGQAPCGGRFAGLAPRQPRAGCGVGAPGRPAPTRGGFWGGAALRPGRAWLRPAAPRWPACGSARAGAALPALGPPGVAAPPRSRRPAA